MKPNDEITVNCTFKIEACQLHNFEYFLRGKLEVIDYKILPSTEKLYKEDSHFKKLVKEVSKAQRIRDVYINDHN